MTKNITLLAFLIMLSGMLFAGRTYSYRLLSGVDNNSIVVEEAVTDSMEGFDSRGGSIVLHKTKTRERHLELKTAFDIAIRYQSLPILAESLSKLERQGARIDIADAFTVIADKLEDARLSKKRGYWAAGFLGAFGCVIPFFDLQNRVAAGRGFGPLYVSGSVDVPKCVMTGIVLTAAGLTAIGSWLSFKDTSRVYVDMIHVLLHSRVCVLSSATKFAHRLDLIKKLLTVQDRERLCALMQPSSARYCCA